MKYFLGAAIALVAVRELTRTFGISSAAGGAIVLVTCLAFVVYYLIKGD